MARASSIWVVQKDGQIIAAFTVRHELQKFLASEHPDLVKVTYLPDGYHLSYLPDKGYHFNNGRVPVQLDPSTLQPLGE